MATMQDRWLGVPIAVSGMTAEARAVLAAQVARWQQARRQVCLSLLLGQVPDLDEPGLTAILPDRHLRQEARRWAMWLVSGGHGLTGWYRATLAAMPDEPMWQREREFFSVLRVKDHFSGPADSSRVWRWHRRRGVELGPWLGEMAATIDLPLPARLQPWIDQGWQPVLGQWLYWDERWVIHLFGPAMIPDVRTLPRVAAALLVPPLVSPASGDYRVQRGDTLWSIAQRQTGTGANWQRIYTANRQRIRHPHWIYPGQVLVVPGAAGSGPTAASETGTTGDAAVMPQRTVSRSETGPVADGSSIVVRPGDTLWRIARQQSGHGSWWPQLWQANRDRLQTPARLTAGMTLRRPVSWSSGLQPSSVTMAVKPPAISSSAATSTTTRPTGSQSPQPAAKPRAGQGAVAANRRATRPSPAVGIRPAATARKPGRVPGAMVPPPPVPPPISRPRLNDRPIPLVPTMPEEILPSDPPSSSLGMGTASVPTAQGQVAQPLNHSAMAPESPVVQAVPATDLSQEMAPSSLPVLAPLIEPVAAAGSDQPAMPEAPIAPAAAESDQPVRVAPTVPPEPVMSPTPAPTPESTPKPGRHHRRHDEDSVLPTMPAAEEQATIRPGEGGADPWGHWLRPDQPDPDHPQQAAAFRLPAVAPAALWPKVGWSGMPEYTVETASNQNPLSGWALNRQQLSAEWQSGAWLLRGRWITAQYGLGGGTVRADRQESWVDVDFGQRWQIMGPLRLGLLGRATWWTRRGGMGQEISLRAADLQGFGLGPVGQMDLLLGGGHHLLVEAVAQPLMGVSFSGPLQAAGQLGQVEGLIGWRGQWGAFQPQAGYRARWIYDADGRFGTVAHGLTAGLAVGWPGAGTDEGSSATTGSPSQ